MRDSGDSGDSDASESPGPLDACSDHTLHLLSPSLFKGRRNAQQRLLLQPVRLAVTILQICCIHGRHMYTLDLHMLLGRISLKSRQSFVLTRTHGGDGHINELKMHRSCELDCSTQCIPCVVLSIKGSAWHH